MATLTLTVTYLGEDAAGNYRYEFAVNINWEGDTPHNIINLYASIEGGPWEYLFLFQVGTGQTGSATQEYAIGSHLPGAHIAFYAGIPGIIASNQVSIIVGEDAEPPPGEPEASLIGIRTKDKTTGIWYSVYPEGLPAKCTPDGVTVSYGAQNVGGAAGYLYGRILGPAGEVLHSGEPRWVAVGNFGYWEPILTMPPYVFALEVEVSETPDYAVSQKIGFNLASTEAPLEEDPLPLIAGAGIAIADAALVGIYLAKVFGLI